MWRYMASITEPAPHSTLCVLTMVPTQRLSRQSCAEWHSSRTAGVAHPAQLIAVHCELSETEGVVVMEAKLSSWYTPPREVGRYSLSHRLPVDSYCSQNRSLEALCATGLRTTSRTGPSNTLDCVHTPSLERSVWLLDSFRLALRTAVASGSMVHRCSPEPAAALSVNEGSHQ